MSLVDVHIELANQSYLSELMNELLEIISRRKELYTNIKTDKNNKAELTGEEEKELTLLNTKEEEILTELLKFKKWFCLPEDVYTHLAEESGIQGKIKKK